MLCCVVLCCVVLCCVVLCCVVLCCVVLCCVVLCCVCCIVILYNVYILSIFCERDRRCLAWDVVTVPFACFPFGPLFACTYLYCGSNKVVKDIYNFFVI